MNALKKNIYLVDGSVLFYRAYYAFIRNPLINSKGENTSATFGFVNSLIKIINEEKPDYIAIAFDTKKPTFRHELYSEYKSNRTEMPDELVAQLPRIKQAVEALNIASFEMEGYEADDIIGTLAKQAAREGFNVWVVTGDKDFFQLVTNEIKIYNPKGSLKDVEKYGPDEVKTKFGVYPELVIDKLALMGDSSDNVPGIPGVGPKSADALLAQFGSLEKVLDNYQSIKAKGLREKVSSNIEKAKLSKVLVTIDTDVPLEYNMQTLKKKEINIPEVKKLFLELEFTRLLKQLLIKSDSDKINNIKQESPQVNYKTITTLDDLKSLVNKLSEKKEIAIDTETTSIKALQAKLVGVSLTDKAKTGYYIPLGHSTDSEQNLPVTEALKEIKILLENPKVQKIGQNIKYDLQVLHRYDIDIKPISFDTMLASYINNPSVRENSLNILAMKYFDYQMQPISELIGSGKNQKTFDIVPVKKAAFYAAEDADYTFRLRGKLAPLIDKYEMNNLYYNIELPLIRVLSDMEETGIRVETNYLAKLSDVMQNKIDNLKKEIYKITGTSFNINSTQQLSHILFEKLNLPTKGKTAKKTGFSTDVKVLEELAMVHPFPKLILDYRQLTKL
ncbi:MAG: DNA polymerase, partial [Candidatus Zixiibacteriota bacterium]